MNDLCNNFIFGQFPVARKLIINGGAIRPTCLLFNLLVYLEHHNYTGQPSYDIFFFNDISGSKHQNPPSSSSLTTTQTKIQRPLVCEESDDDYIPPTQGMLEQLPYLYSAHSLCTCVILLLNCYLINLDTPHKVFTPPISTHTSKDRSIWPLIYSQGFVHMEFQIIHLKR